MDPIKEAFNKAKQDIHELKEQLAYLSMQIEEIKRTLIQTVKQTDKPTDPPYIPSIRQINPTDIPTDSDTPTYNWPLEAVKSPFSNVSIGNRGVPTDRQTDQQTDRQINNTRESASKAATISQVSDLLASLDSIKTGLRSQFKHLTSQEMLVFSTIYQLEEEGFPVDYPLLASKLSLSESSIRDYVLKLTKKGIPLTKIKQGNKKVLLSIPQELKKIASLQAILSLREI